MTDLPFIPPAHGRSPIRTVVPEGGDLLDERFTGLTAKEVRYDDVAGLREVIRESVEIGKRGVR